MFDEDKSGTIEFKVSLHTLTLLGVGLIAGIHLCSIGNLSRTSGWETKVYVPFTSSINLSFEEEGSRNKKEDWQLGAFQLYDINQDGFITYDEMLQIVKSIYKMTGQMVKLPEDEDTPEKVSPSTVAIRSSRRGRGVQEIDMEKSWYNSG